MDLQGLTDRPGDVWRSLLIIGQAAGPIWADRSRRSAVVLSAEREKVDESSGVQLLSDIRSILSVMGLRSSRVQHWSRNCAVWKRRPRGDSRNRLDKRRLAQMLKDFEISPRSLHQPSGQVLRGYRRRDFEDAWIRYLPLAATSATPLHGPPKKGCQ